LFLYSAGAYDSAYYDPSMTQPVEATPAGDGATYAAAADGDPAAATVLVDGRSAGDGLLSNGNLSTSAESAPPGDEPIELNLTRSVSASVAVPPVR
jgi:hypothetical protein